MRRMAVLGATLLSIQCAALATSAPASAAVYGCTAPRHYTLNYAYAQCGGGVGEFRVVATCNSPRWPYTKTLYSPWKYRASNYGMTYTSKVYGDSSGCHITEAWVSTK